MFDIVELGVIKEAVKQLYERSSESLNAMPLAGLDDEQTREQIHQLIFYKAVSDVVLTNIDEQLQKIDRKGQAFLSIPNCHELGHFDNIFQGTPEEVFKLAYEKLGANEFGYISVVNIDETEESDVEEEDAD